MTTHIKTFTNGNGHENYKAAKAWANAHFNFAGPDTWETDNNQRIYRVHVNHVTGTASVVEYTRYVFNWAVALS